MAHEDIDQTVRLTAVVVSPSRKERPRSGAKATLGKVVAAAGGLALVAGLGAGVGIAQAQKNVTIVVDGKPSDATTFTGTVGDVLREAAVSVGPQDAIAPATNVQLADGQTITVNTAKNLTIAGDRGRSSDTTTAYLAMDAARDLATEDSAIVVSRAGARTGPALALQLTDGQRLTVKDAGKARTVVASGGTIETLLRAEGVTLENEDSVNLAVAKDDGVELVITRRHQEERTRTETIAFKKTSKQDPNSYEGTKKVGTKGVKGAKKIVERVTIVNGKVTKTDKVSSTVTKKPVTEVTLVGSKKKPVTIVAGGKDSSGLNWGALARCESGGNPSIVSSNGLYHGLYQFSVSTWHSVGGSGLPSQASAAEQTMRAKKLYSRTGPGSWPVCGRLL